MIRVAQRLLTQMQYLVLSDKHPLSTILIAAFATGSATLHPNAAQAADARPKWAIIATEEGQNTGLADLMANHIGKWKDVDLLIAIIWLKLSRSWSGLSEQKDIELVERE